MKTVTLELPDFIEVKGMSDAPQELRRVPTDKWDADFCLTALRNGISQGLGDKWSTSKKDEGKLRKKWEAFCEGDWDTRERTGESAQKFQAKFDEAIKSLNTQALAGKLTREQLLELAALVKPDA